MINPKIKDILDIYKTLNDGEKNLLIYELDKLGIREDYTFKPNRFRVEYINYYGKHLVDRTFLAMSKRELERELGYFDILNKHNPYNKHWDDSRFSEEERNRYRNNSYTKRIITKL